VDEDRHLEDGVGGEVLELQAVVFQQQEEERGKRQPEATEEIRDEQNELPLPEPGEGEGADANLPAAVGIGPPEHLPHLLKAFLILDAGPTESHLARGGGGERRRKLGRYWQGCESKVAGGASGGCVGKNGKGFQGITLSSSQKSLRIPLT
jgi:hypothetical protein